jgi:hypothetical protein
MKQITELFSHIPTPVARELHLPDIKQITMHNTVTVKMKDGTVRLYTYDTGKGWRYDPLANCKR